MEVSRRPDPGRAEEGGVPATAPPSCLSAEERKGGEQREEAKA